MRSDARKRLRASLRQTLGRAENWLFEVVLWERAIARPEGPDTTMQRDIEGCHVLLLVVHADDGQRDGMGKERQWARQFRKTAIAFLQRGTASDLVREIQRLHTTCDFDDDVELPGLIERALQAFVISKAGEPERFHEADDLERPEGGRP